MQSVDPFVDVSDGAGGANQLDFDREIAIYIGKTFEEALHLFTSRLP